MKIISKSRQSNFQLIFPKLPVTNSILEDEIYRMNIQNTVLPGFSVMASDIPMLGKHNFQETGEIAFDTWTATFQIDQNWENYNILYDWCRSVLNGKNVFASNRNSYQIMSYLEIYDNWKNKINSFVFHNLWPTEIGSIDLNYSSGEELLSCDVTFQYDFFEKYIDLYK